MSQRINLLVLLCCIQVMVAGGEKSYLVLVIVQKKDETNKEIAQRLGKDNDLDEYIGTL